MRHASWIAVLLSILTASAAIAQGDVSETEVVPQDDVATAPRLTVRTPSPDDAPKLAAGAKPGSAPILQSITARVNVHTPRGIIFDLVPDFHFIAPNGNAIVIHRELIDTSGPIGQTNLQDATIKMPAAAQKKGAVQSGGWRCGAGQYYVTIRAFIMDSDGNRSNAMVYTIHCNGG